MAGNPAGEMYSREGLLNALTIERDYHVEHSGAVTQKVLFATVTYLATAAGVVINVSGGVGTSCGVFAAVAVLLGVIMVLRGLHIHEKKHHARAASVSLFLAKAWCAASLEDVLKDEAALSEAMNRQPAGESDTAWFCFGVAFIACATVIGVVGLTVHS